LLAAAGHCFLHISLWTTEQDRPGNIQTDRVLYCSSATAAQDKGEVWVSTVEPLLSRHPQLRAPLLSGHPQLQAPL